MKGEQTFEQDTGASTSFGKAEGEAGSCPSPQRAPAASEPVEEKAAITDPPEFVRPPSLFLEFDSRIVTTIPDQYVDLHAPPSDLAAFGTAIRPAMEQVMSAAPVEPVLYGGRVWTNSRRAVHDFWLDKFARHMVAKEAATVVPRWRLYAVRRPNPDRGYALWFLEELFNLIRPPGFNI